ncbi:hypothetical protein ACFFKU_06190 [Kineococcus gynurae]|uniref:O-antigen ligase n=1 Tax=Kineococcus gynurae TaxID=452979 RepID=A0ABV5LXW8_9ACTN
MTLPSPSRPSPIPAAAAPAAAGLPPRPGGPAGRRVGPIVAPAVARARGRQGRFLTGAASVGGAVLIGMDRTVILSMTGGALVAIALLPVWWPTLRRFRGARLMLALTLATLLSGIALAYFSTTPAGGLHDVDVRIGLGAALRVLGVALGVGLLLWGRRLLTLRWLVGAWAAGSLVANVLDLPGSVNPWKYQLGLPVTLLLLVALAGRGAVSRYRRSDRHGRRLRSRRIGATGTTALALLLMAAVCAVNDYRSFGAMNAITAVLVLYRARRGDRAARRSTAAARGRTGARGPGGRARLVVAAVLLAAIGVGIYRGVPPLLLSGALGAQLQAQAAEQIGLGGGSLLAGGRPESQATLALMQVRPEGFGLGVVPTTQDLLVARAALQTVGLQPGNGYVDRYMFGGQIRLHSIVADLWSLGGLVGLLLAAFLVWTLARAVLVQVAGAPAPGGAEDTTAQGPALTAVVVLMALLGLWDLGFGPIFSDYSEVMAAFAFALAARGTPTPRRGARRPAQVPAATARRGPGSRSSERAPSRSTTSPA